MRCRIAILAATVAFAGCGWTQFRGDSRHTGSNPFERTISVGNVASLTTAWTNSNQDLAAQEVVVRGGRAFVPAPLTFYAIDIATGAVAWSIPRTKGTFGSGTTDGGGGAGQVFAPERWTIYTGRFTGESSGLLHILDAGNGSELDTVPMGGGPPGFAGTWRYQAINADFFPTSGIPTYVHRVDATSGSASFTVDFPQSFVADVATDGEHVFAAAGGPNSLASIPPSGCGTATCTPLWQSATLGEFFRTVSISGPTVFAASETSVLAYPAAGCGQSRCSPLWRTPDPPLGYPIAVAVSGDRLYLTRGPKLEVYAASGCGAAICSPLWTATITGTPTSPSVANGVVYAGSSDGTLFAWDAAGCGATTCAPLLAQVQGAAVGPVSIDQGSLYFTVGGALRKLVIPNPT